MPVIALLGRPNVGKSTLFNRLTKSRDALVADFSGLTRDRQYGHANIRGRGCIVIDTGGLVDETSDIDDLMVRQSFVAATEADLVLLIVDAREGINARDEDIAEQLRRMGKTILLVVNKIDGVNTDDAVSEFYTLGVGDPIPIAASHGRGMNDLVEAIAPLLVETKEEADIPEELAEARRLTIAVVGRPNVGKSTLINRYLGEERLVAYDEPGTTRDSIYVALEYDEEPLILIDTAGVRRRGRIKQAVEKFSVVKTLQSIDQANVVIMLLDARESITDQDASLLGYILEQGRALVLAINKWDRLPQDHKKQIRQQIERKLSFADFADMHFISAKHGTAIYDVLDSAVDAYHSAFRKYSTPQLNRLLEDMISEHQPPMARGRRIKLRYIHQGGVNPPRFIIHGNQTESVPESYRRFLINRMRQQLKIHGTPVQVEFRSGDNPYAGKSPGTKRNQGGRKNQRREHRRHRS
jgi:GTP-binding protein